MNELVITIKHIHKAGMCSKGARKFFLENGIDWNDFLKNGIPISSVAHIDNAFVKQVIGVARNGR